MARGGGGGELEIGAVNCLSVAAVVASAIFQAPSHQEMLSWAAHIYQVKKPSAVPCSFYPGA